MIVRLKGNQFDGYCRHLSGAITLLAKHDALDEWASAMLVLLLHALWNRDHSTLGARLSEWLDTRQYLQCPEADSQTPVSSCQAWLQAETHDHDKTGR